MKLRIFIVLVAVVLAWVAGRSIKSGGEHIVASVQEQAQGGGHDDATTSHGSSERRINESYELTEGAHVNVSGINGPVSIEAVDGDTAEVQVTSTAGSMSDLNASQITVEHTESSLTVRGKGNNHGGFWKWLTGKGETRHNVVLKLPRHVALEARGTNGKLTIGEMEGAVKVSGVNGRVEIGGAGGLAEVNGVNGGVTITIMELPKEGAKVNGINGGVELRLGSDVNADLNINGVNGSITLEAPNVEVQEQKRSKLRARVGTGGASIKANGINGGVRIVGV
jgi:HSP20 family molecular chaperone IbpA